MVPPTRETIRLMAVWAETLCEPWLKCHEELKKYDSGQAENFGRGKSQGIMNSPFQVRMLKIMNGTLYFDWPFGYKERFGSFSNRNEGHSGHALIQLVLGKVKDIKDATFFFGEEVAYMPYHFPFFGFSASPTMRHADLPWPWRAHQVAEIELYRKYMSSLTSRSSSSEINERLARYNAHAGDFNDLNISIWKQKKSKAVFYGSMSSLRHIFFDVAIANSNLFDFGWTGGINSSPWNPLSVETD